MDKAILDTDVFSEILKGRDAVLQGRAAEYHSAFGGFTITAITVAEIVKGLHKYDKAERLRQFEALLQHMEVLPFDGPAGIIAGRIYADLERQGQPIGRADPMIAAIAICHDFTLVTGNQQHFARIQMLHPSFRLANWKADAR